MCNAGNQCFVTGDDDDAVEKYTMSLGFAKSKEAMALAVANRSAALYRKQLYRECLIDIDAALTFGYPEEKRQKLKERAEKAVGGLQQLYQVKDQNMNDLPATKDSKLQNDKDNIQKNKNFSLVMDFLADKTGSKVTIEDHAKECIEELMSKIPKNTPRYLIEENELTLNYGSNHEVPALSKGVKIAYSEKYGRHLIATDSFKPGNIISMETPYSYVIYTEKLVCLNLVRLCYTKSQMPIWLISSIF